MISYVSMMQVTFRFPHGVRKTPYHDATPNVQDFHASVLCVNASRYYAYYMAFMWMIFSDYELNCHVTYKVSNKKPLVRDFDTVFVVKLIELLTLFYNSKVTINVYIYMLLSLAKIKLISVDTVLVNISINTSDY